VGPENVVGVGGEPEPVFAPANSQRRPSPIGTRRGTRMLCLDPPFGHMSSLGLATVDTAKPSGFRGVIRSENAASSSENLRVETEQALAISLTGKTLEESAKNDYSNISHITRRCM